MAVYRNLWQELCSEDNLELAFREARKHKTLKPDVIEFEKKLNENLSRLRTELLFHSYQPKPLKTFILRDPKTRKISKSDFRDRVIHHALCNIIEKIFDRGFISDSYANRRRKGALKAIKRFESFSNKVSKNHHQTAFVLKADVRHYFETVDKKILLKVIETKIKDPKIIWLIKKILNNYSASENKGMPLGNLTSQFFANVYLNELDQFVKHKLKAKYYIRYVDDFVILNESQKLISEWKQKIDIFLKENLSLELHPDKSKIVLLERGVDFLGFKIFLHHRLLKKRNFRKFKRKLTAVYSLHHQNQIDYDEVYDFLEGWLAYTKYADTYNARQKIISCHEQRFSQQISTKEINRGK